jgi:hypothetical protein
MNPKTLVYAAVAGACMVLAACHHAVTPPAPPPPSRASCAGGGMCKVDVVPAEVCIGSPCTGTSPDIKFTSAGDVRVLWKLPPNYGFCPLQGDGVFLKANEKDDGQFEDPYATDDEATGGKPPAIKGCSRVYHWRALNTAAGKKYEHLLRFHDLRTGRLHVIDPWIINN